MAADRQKIREFFKAPTRRAGLTIAVFMVLLAGAFALLATGVIPGLPDAPLKPVTLFPSPQGEASPVALFLEPPAATLQAGGGGQLLALQFSNRSAATFVTLNPTSVEPRNCFALRPLDTEPSQLAPGETHVSLYRLTAAPDSSGRAASPACEGQVALTLRYSYQASAPAASAQTAGIQTAGTQTAAARRGEGFVSTSPILITTLHTLRFERFFRIASALIIPVLLAIATFLIQQFQTQKADRQKEEELRLEVWKMIFPIVNGLNQKHYIQLVRKMGYAQVQVHEAQRAWKEGRTPDGRLLAASLVRVRAAYMVLNDLVGGYSFRNMPAESICYDLSEHMWKYCRNMLGKDSGRFDDFAAGIARKDSIAQVADKLDAHAANDPDLQRCLKLFQDAVVEASHLDVIDRLLGAIGEILAFENNVLWYPEWYKTPPILHLSQLTLEGMDLAAATRTQLLADLQQYSDVVPEKCRG